MNIKPSFLKVINQVGQTQDGKKISDNNEYSRFLLQLIRNSTETKSGAIETGKVNTEELAMNLRYAISVFKNALIAVEKFNQ